MVGRSFVFIALLLIAGGQVRANGPDFISTLWEMATFERTIESYGVSENDGLLVMAGDDWYIHVYDYRQFTLKARFDLNEISRGLGLIDRVEVYDSLVAFKDVFGEVIVISWQTGVVHYRSTGHGGQGGQLCFSPDGRYLYVSNDSHLPGKNSIEEIDCRTFTSRRYPVSEFIVRILPDTGFMHVVLFDGKVYELRYGQGLVDSTVYVHNSSRHVVDAAYSPQRRQYALLLTSESELMLIGRGEQAPVSTYRMRDDNSLTFLDEGQVLCTANYHAVKFIEPRHGTVLRSVADLANRKLLRSLGGDRVLYLEDDLAVQSVKLPEEHAQPFAPVAGSIQSIITNHYSGNTYIVQHNQQNNSSMLMRIRGARASSAPFEYFPFDFEISDATQAGLLHECVLLGANGDIYSWDGDRGSPPVRILQTGYEHATIEYVEDRDLFCLARSGSLQWYDAESWAVVNETEYPGNPIDIKYEQGHQYLIIRSNDKNGLWGMEGTGLYEFDKDTVSYMSTGFDLLYGDSLREGEPSQRNFYWLDMRSVKLLYTLNHWRFFQLYKYGLRDDFAYYFTYAAQSYEQGAALMVLYRDSIIHYYRRIGDDPETDDYLQWRQVHSAELAVPSNSRTRWLFTKECPGRVFYHSAWYVRYMTLDVSVTDVRPLVAPEMFGVYPNPAEEGAPIHVQSKYEADQLEELSLHDVLGRRVWSGTGVRTIPSPQRRGVYFLRIKTHDNTVMTRKLLVR